MSNINPKYVREVWTIKLEDGRFLLFMPGDIVCKSKVDATPRQLAKLAWDQGAQEIKYDFDLNLDPDK